MDHQDFKTVVFNNKKDIQNDKNKKEAMKKVSQRQNNDPESIKIQADKQLGKMLSQARIAKGYNKQSDFVKQLSSSGINVSIQIYSKWEQNKEIPTNDQISKMEKILGTKLPRNKKIKVDPN